MGADVGNNALSLSLSSRPRAGKWLDTSCQKRIALPRCAQWLWMRCRDAVKVALVAPSSPVVGMRAT
jgi:hypothetical protein